LANSVQPLTNYVQNVRLAKYNQAVQLVLISYTFSTPCMYRKFDVTGNLFSA
jgi:hypothetical protein